MKQSTLDCMNEMVEWVNADPKNVVIPMFFQNHGLATVSSAVRVAKKRGLIVQDGVDGCGKPKYRAPMIVASDAKGIPMLDENTGKMEWSGTHTVSNTVN